MKVILLLCLACTVFASVEEDRQQWLEFRNKHIKTYKNLQEDKLRFSIFQENLREIEEHNQRYEAGEETYKTGINKFTDLTKEEFASLLKRQSTRPNLGTQTAYIKPVGAEVPETFDWREQGAVSAVKDQGNCGSCWAFSVIGTVESFYYLKNNEMVTFSEQQLVDCDTGNWGCDGGDEGPALDYIKKYGIESDTTYPYKAVDQKCGYDESAVYTKVSSYVLLKEGDEDDLQSAVALSGPISVAMDASHLSSYDEGVYTSKACSKRLRDTDHAVLAIGYGHDAATGLDYWLIKNSWGTDWGEDGYFKIRRGDNECAIATESIYPVF